MDNVEKVCEPGPEGLAKLLQFRDPYYSSECSYLYAFIFVLGAGEGRNDDRKFFAVVLDVFMFFPASGVRKVIFECLSFSLTPGVYFILSPPSVVLPIGFR